MHEAFARFIGIAAPARPPGHDSQDPLDPEDQNALVAELLAAGFAPPPEA